jgi:hypothetical protein
MDTTLQSLANRIADLERTNRRQRWSIVTVLSVAGLIGAGSYPTAQSSDPLRVRGLIVEDANGRPRIVIGRMDAATASTRGLGLRINGPNGEERFGLSLNDQGSVVMGFDAPPGKGDDRNRERINIVADSEGGRDARECSPELPLRALGSRSSSGGCGCRPRSGDGLSTRRPDDPGQLGR